MALEGSANDVGNSVLPDVSTAPPPPSSSGANADDVLSMMNRMPLFMTELDDSDGAGGANEELEALKALAFEGTPVEIAANFKQQGNDCVKSRLWSDAREFYTKAIAALKGGLADNNDRMPESEWFGSGDRQVVDLDEEKEKERQIEEACYVNRALCNLELKNYGSCNRDCASALQINPRNVKAFYRSATACLMLDKISAAIDACERAATLDASNTAVPTLRKKIEARKTALEKMERERHERIQKKHNENQTLQRALINRNISVNWTRDAPVDAQDAKLTLAVPLDDSSTLSIPVILLYPTAAQSDLIKAFQEGDTLLDHFDYIFPCPWDDQGAFSKTNVECFMETSTGGLVKVGKKVPLAKVLAGGKTQLKDGLCTIYVVPVGSVPEWLAEFKRRKIT